MSVMRTWNDGRGWSISSSRRRPRPRCCPGRSPACSRGANAGVRGPSRRRSGSRWPAATIELCRALADAFGAAGYRAEAIDDQEIGGLLRAGIDRRPVTERVLTIWEIPVLEPGWAERLEWRATRTGPVIVLAGFADRAIVARARAAGAVACLELPCDIDDLIDTVNRAVRSTDLESWPVPPRAEPPHGLPPRPHRRADRPGSSAASSPWSERGPLPRIPTNSGVVASGNSAESPVHSGTNQSRAQHDPRCLTVRSHPISSQVRGLKDLTRLIQRAPGFPEVLAALKNGRSATIDGAWGSAAALAAAALGLHAPTTLVIVLAHVGDVDDFRDDVATFAGITPGGLSRLGEAAARAERRRRGLRPPAAGAQAT